MSIGSDGMRQVRSFGPRRKNSAMEEKSVLRTYLPVGFVSIVLFLGVFWAFESAKSRPSTIILPGGITYLGPSSTPIPLISPITLKWISRTGTIYPYSFDYPSSLNLGVFPNDPTDSVTAFIDDTDANTNIFFRVESCKGGPCGIEYARSWWKQYAWKGVASVSEFTNSHGLTGYRAKYLNEKNQTPYDHVFFSLPDKADRMIWLSGKLFSKEDFEKLIDSVNWKN